MKRVQYSFDCGSKTSIWEIPMLNDPVLINDWHPVARTSDLDSQPILSIRLLGEDIVLWKSGDRYMAWQDLCIHRGSRLSAGITEPLLCTVIVTSFIDQRAARVISPPGGV